MWEDEHKDETKSARIPEHANEIVEERLLESDVTSSKVIRWALAPLAVEDEEEANKYLNFIEETYDDPLRQSWKSRVNYLLEQNPGYLEALEKGYAVDADEREKAVDGIKDLVIGVAASDYDKAMKGGEKLKGVDRELSDAAAFYVSWIPDEYWDR